MAKRKLKQLFLLSECISFLQNSKHIRQLFHDICWKFLFLLFLSFYIYSLQIAYPDRNNTQKNTINQEGILAQLPKLLCLKLQVLLLPFALAYTHLNVYSHYSSHEIKKSTIAGFNRCSWKNGIIGWRPCSDVFSDSKKSETVQTTAVLGLGTNPQ